MNKIRKLKKELGNKYLFRRFISDKEIRRLQKTYTAEFEPMTVAELTAGYVKIECSIYKSEFGLQLGYDVFVKDAPSSAYWIFYDSPNVLASTKESDMLSVLNRVVEENGLSYTECCFKKLDGKIVKANTKAKYNRV